MNESAALARTPSECVRCGAALPRLSRRKVALCRVCAAQAAQTFLRDALSNRRRRPRVAED